MNITVVGAGGFIAGHLIKRLLKFDPQRIIAMDIKPLDEWWQVHDDRRVCNIDYADARDPYILKVCIPGDTHAIYNLACDMGGIGFIENYKYHCAISVLINTNIIRRCIDGDIALHKYFYSSSACVYPSFKQDTTEVIALKESDAYPADPEDGYGWEKLYSERMTRHFADVSGTKVYIARFHNIYGPYGTWKGGREKAPAAMCRKVIEAMTHGGDLEIWGDGEQKRSFCYIDDCVEGIIRLVCSNHHEPINIGSDEVVSINDLANIVENLAEVCLERRHKLDAPQGVRGRNSDNTLIKRVLGWAPSTPLVVGMSPTFEWIRNAYLHDVRDSNVLAEDPR